MKNILSATLLALLLAAPVRAATVADFLNMDVGARASALGGAYSAVSDDATALYWNPAALTRIERRSATLMHAASLNSSALDYAAYGQNVGKWGAWGLGMQYYSAGSITQTDVVGAEVGSFTPYDVAVTAAYAYKLPHIDFMPEFSGISMGLGLKYIQSKILSSAHTMAVDMGLLSPLCFDGRLRGALTLTNMGGRLGYGSDNESLLRSLRIGAAMQMNPRWIISADGVMPSKGVAHGSLGTEYVAPIIGGWTVAGRTGLNTETLQSGSGFSGVSLGFGIGYVGRMFDYAFVPLGVVGQVHRVSLTAHF